MSRRKHFVVDPARNADARLFESKPFITNDWGIVCEPLTKTRASTIHRVFDSESLPVLFGYQNCNVVLLFFQCRRWCDVWFVRKKKWTSSAKWMASTAIVFDLSADDGDRYVFESGELPIKRQASSSDPRIKSPNVCLHQLWHEKRGNSPFISNFMPLYLQEIWIWLIFDHADKSVRPSTFPGKSLHKTIEALVSKTFTLKLFVTNNIQFSLGRNLSYVWCCKSNGLGSKFWQLIRLFCKFEHWWQRRQQGRRFLLYSKSVCFNDRIIF